MAKLTKLPNLAIINGFKGVIDFYFNMGLPCARSWPRSPGRNRSPAVRSWWPPFSYATRAWGTLESEIRDAYRHNAAGTTMSGYELFIKSYISGFIGQEL